MKNCSAPLKIFYVSQRSLPSRRAHALQIFNTCAALAERGARLTLVAKHRELRRGHVAEAGKWPLPASDYFGVMSNFALLTPRPMLGDILRRRDSNWRFLGASLAFARCHRADCDVAFTRSAFVALHFARQGFVVALEVHDLDCLQDEAMQTLQREFAPVSRSAFLGFVAISQTLASGLIEAGIPSDSIVVAHDGIDLTRFQNPQTTATARQFLRSRNSSWAELLDDSRFIVGYCGHFYPGRGLEMLIECARRRPDWTFLLVGGMEVDVARIQNLGEKFGLTNVIFPGFVKNTELAPFLWACDALSMPYETTQITSNFMSPMKMFEYMACGRAIVSADWPQIREVLRADENALLHERGNVESLELALEKLASNPESRTRLAQNALQDVRNFTWDERARRILGWLNGRLALLYNREVSAAK